MQNRTKRVNYRVTEVEHRQIQKLAQRAKMTVTDYVVASSLKDNIVIIDDLKPLVSQLKAVGRNLNQLTVMARMGNIQAVRLDEVAVMLKTIYREIEKLLEVAS
jgi:uncharacterized protein (DUF1778 family)